MQKVEDFKRKMKKLTTAIQEIYETRNRRRVLVGHQQYDPFRQIFIFIFDRKYPAKFRAKKIKEIKNISDATGWKVEIK